MVEGYELFPVFHVLNYVMEIGIRDECLICMFLEVALSNSSLKKKKKVDIHDPMITCLFWLGVVRHHLAYNEFFSSSALTTAIFK